MNKIKKEILIEILKHNLLEKQIVELSTNEILGIKKALNNELLLNLTTEQIINSPELCLSELVENNLTLNRSGKNILDVFEVVQQIAKDEIHHSISFHWFARWDEFYDIGNFLTQPDSYDFVEVVLRIEEEFNLKIDNASVLETIGDTIRYIWKRLLLDDKATSFL